MGNGDNFALDWIRGELESTLDQARAALESYAEGGREETRLRSCLTSLHQVHGTLRMLELEGVVLLADHMEQTAQSLLNGSIKDSRMAEQSLMQSILQLPAFIEEVQSGVTEDLPLVMPYVNELRSCCGLSPMQLTPQVSAEFTAEQAAEAMQRFRGINGAEKAARVRSAYQQVLLSVLKGGASAQTVETLGKIAIGMQRICEGAPLVTLWKALEHFAKGYASDPQKMSSEAIRDLRRVDAQMKKVVTDGAEVLVEPLPVELVRDLLRAAEARGERDEQITALRSAVQTPQAPALKPREALDQAAGVLGDEIAAVRDRFDLYTRSSDRSVEALQELTAPLDNICSTLSILGDSDGADLLHAQRANVLSLTDDSQITDDIILAIAGSLVQTQQGLSGSGEIASGDEALSNAALNEAQIAVLQEARAGIDQVKQSIVDFVSSKWNTGYLEESPGVLAAVQGALTMIPLTRASALLAQCGDYLSEQLLKGHHPDWQELDAFADALGGIDYFLERLFETGRVPGDEALNLTEESLQRLLGADQAVESGDVDTDFAASTESAVADETEDLAEDLAEAREEDQPLDGAGGDAALTAMLGARPEELKFQSGNDVDVGADSSLELVALSSDDEDQGEDHSAATAETAETDAEAAEEFALEPEVALDATADDPTAEDTAEDTGDVDLAQTAFVDSTIAEQNTSESVTNEGAFGSGIAAASDSQADAGSGFADSGFGAAGLAAGAIAAAGLVSGSDSESEELAAAPEIPTVDPEIVEIFVEEVDEVLEAIEAQLPDWSEDLTAVTPITEIRRSFHTLKGSGRIVGANQIGELGWAVENMLNRLMDGTIAPSEDHLFIVSHSCSIVPALREDFAEGRASDRSDLVELLEQVDVLASGGVLSGALASSKPAVDKPLDQPMAMEQSSADGESDIIDEEDFPIWDDGGVDSEDKNKNEFEGARPPSVDVPSFFDAQPNPGLVSEIGNDGPDNSTDDSTDASTSSLELLAEELQEHLEALSTRVRDSHADNQLELDSPFTRALHTIAGSAATAGEFSVVGIAEPLQDVASAVLRERGGIIDGEYLAFVREGVYALQRLFDADATGNELTEEDSAMFAAEAERLLGGLLEAPDSPTSLLESDDTVVLLDAREYLDSWRFEARDSQRAEQMNSALMTVVERAHSEDFAELAQVLHQAHGQFGSEPLNEERHQALVAAHEDILSQLDALAAGQVAELTLESRERLQDLMASHAPVIPELKPETEEPLDPDAEEALAYTLDESEAFDLDALDDDVFGSDDVTPIEDIPEAQAGLEPEPESEEAAEVPLLAAGIAAAATAAVGLAATDTKDSDVTEDAEEVDPELLAIFFEEADEILEEFDHNLQSWSEERGNRAPLDHLLRGLHTLKGGARLAGMTSLGDMTHNYESDLIEIQNAQADISDAQFEIVQQRYDDLVEEVALARRGGQSPGEESPVADSSITDSPVTYSESADSSSVAESVQEPAEASVEVISPVVEPEVEPDVEPEVEREDDTDTASTDAESGAAEDDFAVDVAAAFSPEAIADMDAQVEREHALRVEANEASIASSSESSSVDEPVEIVPLASAASDLETGDDDTAVSSSLEKSKELSREPTKEEDRARNNQEMVRVSASLLEDLVNLAGESSIVRARVEQGISDFGGALEEMETTIERVREQLRRLEIETETRVSSRVERAQGPAYEDFDPLEMDRYSQLQQLTRSLTESATDMMDLKETLRYRARESETLLLQQARLNTELQEGLMRTRMVPFSRLMPRLRRIVRQVSRDLGKQVEFQAYNAEGELDRNVLERMVPPLEHMLRNAIDHGIENEDLRKNFGKPNIGHIGLKLSREGGDVVIEISDDGAGIDVETVRTKAVERGLMAADAALTDEQVLDFVLAPGFSTAQSLTQISGRGVGMDVVHSEVKQLGGSIEIGSVPGRGTTFTVRLPFTVSVNRALMVTLGDDQYAIPLNTIEGIVLLPSDDLSRHYGPQGAPFEYAGVPYRVRYLGSYLGREYVSRTDQSSVPVVLVRSGDQAVAVHVDDVQGSREIVVKSLGPQFAGVGGISGATILGDGSVVIILDLLSLMRARGPGKSVDSRQPMAVEEERLVMVVDDSVTVRKVTSRLLERQGMSVITAKDGVEAVSMLQERMPDIVLLDIEMPRMDGFEVARQVRRDERLADLPIVMISSRTGEKHTERARELGVNRFLGKPFQENELLETIDELVTRS